jgi:hypothetical protein
MESKSNCYDECPEPVFKIDTPNSKPKTVFKCDTVELCSDTLDIEVSGCCKKKVSIENRPFTKKLPVQQGQTVQPGDLVTIAKTGGQVGVRKLLCEQWEWVACIDTEFDLPDIGGLEEEEGKDGKDGKTNLDAITLNGAKAIATDGCGNVYVVSWGFLGDLIDVGGKNLEEEGKDNEEGKDGKDTEIKPLFYDAGPDGNTVSTDNGLMGTPTDVGIITSIIVGKLKSNGVWEWVASIGADQPLGAGDMIIFPAITVDSCGNAYVVSRIASEEQAVPIFYNTGPDGSPIVTGNEIMGRQTNTDSEDQIFVGKIKPDGVWEWATSIEHGHNVGSITADQCGNIYVGCNSNDSNPNIVLYDAGPTGSTVTTTTGNEITGIVNDGQVVCKLKPTGQWEWITSIENGGIQVSIDTDSCGNIYAASLNTNAAPIFYDAGPDGSTITTGNEIVGLASTSTTDVAIYVSKLKPTGKWEWVAAINSPAPELIPSIAVDSCSNIYVAGYGAAGEIPLFYDTGPNGSTISTGNELMGKSTVTGDIQIFVGKIKTNGKWEWVAGIDSPENDGSPSVSTDSCGNIYVTGFGSSGTAPTFYNAGVTGNTTTLNNHISGRTSVNSQIFIGKLVQDGRWIWAVAIDDVLSTDEKGKEIIANIEGISFTNGSVTVDNCGNIYVAGAAASEVAPTFYNAGPDGSTIQGPTGDELFGKQTISSNPQIFIGKLANDPKTQPVIGIVQQVDQINNCAVIKFGGVVDANQDEPLEPGCPYYISSYGPVDPTVSKLTTEPCNPDVCNCPNRCLGVSCDEESIIWELEDPLCVKPKCCCCCIKINALNNNF